MKFTYIPLIIASVTAQCNEEDGVVVTSSTFPESSGFYRSVGGQTYVNTEGVGVIGVDPQASRWVWDYGGSFCFTTGFPFGNPGTGGVSLGNNGPDKQCTTYDVEFSCPEDPVAPTPEPIFHAPSSSSFLRSFLFSFLNTFYIPGYKRQHKKSETLLL